MVFTCSNEHIRDVLFLDILDHPEAQEVHHPGQVILIGDPGDTLDVEVLPSELASLDIMDHLLDGLLIHFLDIDFNGPSCCPSPRR